MNIRYAAGHSCYAGPAGKVWDLVMSHDARRFAREGLEEVARAAEQDKMVRKGSNMRAFVLQDGVSRLREDAPVPVPGPHEVLVRVLLAGICETDLQLMQGYMQFNGTLGHEFVGIAESGRYTGQRVVGEINCCPVERCARCPENRRHCPRRTVLGILQRDGAFAEYVAIPEENLHPVPEHVGNDRAVFTEPLAAAFEILEQFPQVTERRVLVLGDGRLGYLCAQVLASAGARVCVVGKHRAKLARCAARDLQTCLLEDVPREWMEQRSAEVVVDCTGSPTGFEWACRLVQPRGTIILKTTVAGTQTLSLAPLVIDEIQVLGSRCGPFSVALRALAEERIEVESLITARYPLTRIVEALELACRPDQHKVLVDIEVGHG
ncbi:MAG: alcohol dehydrogenase catalytic domain-containing protein [Planctomycetaceae bacterium]|nr:alcohol dehydrogenase catalytic domain-containing protein [Planctomycetaceae bacterium]